MSGDPSTDPADNDPFKSLEGLGEGLEASFEELDRKVGSRPEATDDAGGSESGARGEPSEEASDDPFGVGDFGDFEGLGDMLGMEGMGRMLAEFSKLISRSLSTNSADLLKQVQMIALNVATADEPQRNVDPSERIATEQLMRVAELQVANATGLDPSHGRSLRVEVVNPAGWLARTHRDYQDLLNAMLAPNSDATPPDDPDDPSMSAMLAGLGHALSPIAGTFAAGNALGRLARRAMGGYSLAVPRPVDEPVIVVLPNVDAHARKHGLELSATRLWACVGEAAHHAVLGLDHVRSPLQRLLLRHAAGFTAGLAELKSLTGDMTSMGLGGLNLKMMGMLGDENLPFNLDEESEEVAPSPELVALTTALAGYIGHVTGEAVGKLIGETDSLRSAQADHRAGLSEHDLYLERIMGFDLGQHQTERGEAFVAGVIERAGADALNRLVASPGNLPTPAEVDAPGLWLARIDLPR